MNISQSVNWFEFFTALHLRFLLLLFCKQLKQLLPAFSLQSVKDIELHTAYRQYQLLHCSISLPTFVFCLEMPAHPLGRKSIHRCDSVSHHKSARCGLSVPPRVGLASLGHLKCKVVPLHWNRVSVNPCATPALAAKVLTNRVCLPLMHPIQISIVELTIRIFAAGKLDDTIKIATLAKILVNCVDCLDF